MNNDEEIFEKFNEISRKSISTVETEPKKNNSKKKIICIALICFLVLSVIGVGGWLIFKFIKSTNKISQSFGKKVKTKQKIKNKMKMLLVIFFSSFQKKKKRLKLKLQSSLLMTIQNLQVMMGYLLNIVQLLKKKIIVIKIFN